MANLLLLYDNTGVLIKKKKKNWKPWSRICTSMYRTVHRIHSLCCIMVFVLWFSACNINIRPECYVYIYILCAYTNITLVLCFSLTCNHYSVCLCVYCRHCCFHTPALRLIALAAWVSSMLLSFSHTTNHHHGNTPLILNLGGVPRYSHTHIHALMDTDTHAHTHTHTYTQFCVCRLWELQCEFVLCLCVCV